MCYICAYMDAFVQCVPPTQFSMYRFCWLMYCIVQRSWLLCGWTSMCVSFAEERSTQVKRQLEQGAMNGWRMVAMYYEPNHFCFVYNYMYKCIAWLLFTHASTHHYGHQWWVYRQHYSNEFTTHIGLLKAVSIPCPNPMYNGAKPEYPCSVFLAPFRILGCVPYS